MVNDKMVTEKSISEKKYLHIFNVQVPNPTEGYLKFKFSLIDW